MILPNDDFPTKQQNERLPDQNEWLPDQATKQKT